MSEEQLAPWRALIDHEILVTTNGESCAGTLMEVDTAWRPGEVWLVFDWGMAMLLSETTTWEPYDQEILRTSL